MHAVVGQFKAVFSAKMSYDLLPSVQNFYSE